MILFNQKNELMSDEDIKKLKAEILAEYDNEATPSEEELEAELANDYIQGQKLSLQPAGFMAKFSTLAGEEALALPGFGRPIFKRVKKAICSVLSNEATVEEILDVIIDVVTKIIPGGIIFKKLIKRILKYIIELGVERFCGV